MEMEALGPKWKILILMKDSFSLECHVNLTKLILFFINLYLILLLMSVKL